MRLNTLFSESVYVQQINKADEVLAAGSYPASGSYIDVSKFQKFAFLVELGTTAHAQDWKVQQATANNGTLKDVATAAAISSAADSDGKWFLIEVDSNELDINNAYKFVTLTNANGGTGDYAQITFLGLAPYHQPVTQHSSKGGIATVAG